MSDCVESPRRVVFHADDFGMNPAVNEGIVTTFRKGLLTSTSLLANAPAAEAACQTWSALTAEFQSGRLPSALRRQQLTEPEQPFDLGIHLNLTQGSPLTGTHFPNRLLDHQGNFPGVGKLFFRLSRAGATERKLVAAELQAQIEWMFDHGYPPTHLNGHQYIELIPVVSMMIPEIMKRYAIPTVRVAEERGLIPNLLLRGEVTGWCLSLIKRYYAGAFRRRMRGEPCNVPDRFFGTSHAGRIDSQLLSRFLQYSRDASLTEIGVHPASPVLGDDLVANDPWFDPLAAMRPNELNLLCSLKLDQELAKRNLGLGRLGQPRQTPVSRTREPSA
jgi:predicted glycoside hydrolase/deacetylase ChbG (UPF0249 family)